MDMIKFKALLDDQVTWPDYYTFKFVVKTDKTNQILNMLENHTVSQRPSKNGTYTSFTSRKLFNNADEVLAVYESVSKIEGVIAL